MADTANSDRVEVEPLVVLMAFRYGLGRLTYAHQDALSLLRQHWPALIQWRRTIIDDLRFTLRVATQRDIIASTSRTLEWVEAQP